MKKIFNMGPKKESAIIVFIEKDFQQDQEYCSMGERNCQTGVISSTASSPP
jgi:hypothetical protein